MCNLIIQASLAQAKAKSDSELAVLQQQVQAAQRLFEDAQKELDRKAKLEVDFTAQLAQLRHEHDVQLQTARKLHVEELSHARGSGSEQIELMRQQLKAVADEDIKELKRTHEAALTVQGAQLRDELARVKARAAEDQDLLRQQLKATSDTDSLALRHAHANELAAVKSRQAEELVLATAALTEKHDAARKQLISEHTTEITTMRTRHAEELNALRQQLLSVHSEETGAKLKSILDTHANEKGSIQSQKQEEVELVRKQLNVEKAAEILQLQDAHSKELASVRAEQTAALQTERARIKAEADAMAQDELAKSKKQLMLAHQVEVQQLKAGHGSSMLQVQQQHVRAAEEANKKLITLNQQLDAKVVEVAAIKQTYEEKMAALNLHLADKHLELTRAEAAAGERISKLEQEHAAQKAELRAEMSKHELAAVAASKGATQEAKSQQYVQELEEKCKQLTAQLSLAASQRADALAKERALIISEHERQAKVVQAELSVKLSEAEQAIMQLKTDKALLEQSLVHLQNDKQTLLAQQQTLQQEMADQAKLKNDDLVKELADTRLALQNELTQSKEESARLQAELSKAARPSSARGPASSSASDSPRVLRGKYDDLFKQFTEQEAHCTTLTSLLATKTSALDKVTAEHQAALAAKDRESAARLKGIEAKLQQRYPHPFSLMFFSSPPCLRPLQSFSCSNHFSCCFLLSIVGGYLLVIFIWLFIQVRRTW